MKFEKLKTFRNAIDGRSITHSGCEGPTEIGSDLLELADVVATDSPSQLRADMPTDLVFSSPHADRVQALGAVAAGRVAGRADDSQVTVYLSTGLAGTEVHLLYRAVGVRTPHTDPHRCVSTTVKCGVAR